MANDGERQAGAWAKTGRRLRRVVFGLCALATLGSAPRHAMAAEAQAAAADRWSRFSVPVFRNHSPQEGLPHPIVTALADDVEGFLWVGTQGGLARWDGYRFRAYTAAAGGQGALPDSFITALYRDRRGRLWVGTSAGGLARYDRALDQFVTYRAGDTGLSKTGLSNASVVAIEGDGNGGNLWIGTEEGLNHLDPATGRIAVWRHIAGDAGSLPDDRILSLLRDRSGALWVGTRNGLARRASGSDRFVAVPIHANSTREIAVSSLFEGQDGRVWIGTTKYGVFAMAPGEARAEPFGAVGSDVSGFENDWIYSMIRSDEGEVWFGTGRGIVILDPSSGRARRVLHEPSVGPSLAHDTVWAMHRDRSGGIWVGTTAGVGRLETNNGAVATVFGETGNPRGLSDRDVMSVVAASDGHIWLGLRTGIDIVDPVSGRIANLPSDEARPKTALPNRVQAFAGRPDGGMFIGTNRGLYRADASGTGLARVSVPGRDPELGIYAVFPAAGRLWVGGGADGLWSFVPGDDTAPGAEHFGADRLTDQRIMTVAAGASNDLWIGTRNGLNRLDLATREVERIAPAKDDARALAAGFVSSLLLDPAGRLWVGTFGGGIQILIGREAGRPVFHRIGVDQGLPDANVNCVLADAKGRIWASTDNGIAVIDPVSFAVQALGHADGVAVLSYWAHSCAVTASGELLFGGLGGGLTVIRPDRYRRWDQRPPMVVTEARVGGKNVLSSHLNGASGEAALVVPSDANSVSVEFSALDYSAPEANRYAYRLEGFDRDWIDTDPTRRLAAYTNLPPGDYTLRLRGSNRNGTWAEQGLGVAIRVLPAWYQTALFRTFAVLVAGAGIFSLMQARTRYLRRRQRELERLVVERTAQLEASKREIEKVAFHDALTGLPNRRLFMEEIRKLIARGEREGSHFALLLIDLDRFKQINDTLGHDAGDALLVEAARRIQAAVRLTDIAARIGGDEFAVLLGEVNGDGASERSLVEAIGRRLVEGFVAKIPFGQAEMSISASIGLALFPANGKSHEELFKAADLALYEAKRNGRNTWRWQTAASVQAALVYPG